MRIIYTLAANTTRETGDCALWELYLRVGAISFRITTTVCSAVEFGQYFKLNRE